MDVVTVINNTFIIYIDENYHLKGLESYRTCVTANYNFILCELLAWTG